MKTGPLSPVCSLTWLPRPPSWWPWTACRGSPVCLRLLFLWACLLGWQSSCLAEDPDRLRQVQAVFLAAQTAHDTNRNALEPAWVLGRAAYDWAELQTRDPERARIAETGIAACRSALSNAPAAAAAHYYLALCQGQLARTKRLGALKLVSQMEVSLLAARALDPTLDEAGPDRSLGLLYLDAPGWPTSLGSRTKARRHLELCVNLAPGYPDNRLSWAEALVRWRETEGARTQLKALDDGWEASRTQWTGPAWAPAWVDWEARRQKLRLQLQRTSARGDR